MIPGEGGGYFLEMGLIVNLEGVWKELQWPRVGTIELEVET